MPLNQEGLKLMLKRYKAEVPSDMLNIAILTELSQGPVQKHRSQIPFQQNFVWIKNSAQNKTAYSMKNQERMDFIVNTCKSAINWNYTVPSIPQLFTFFHNHYFPPTLRQIDNNADCIILVLFVQIKALGSNDSVLVPDNCLGTSIFRKYTFSVFGTEQN